MREILQAIVDNHHVEHQGPFLACEHSICRTAVRESDALYLITLGHKVVTAPKD